MAQRAPPPKHCRIDHCQVKCQETLSLGMAKKLPLLEDALPVSTSLHQKYCLFRVSKWRVCFQSLSSLQVKHQMQKNYEKALINEDNIDSLENKTSKTWLQ